MGNKIKGVSYGKYGYIFCIPFVLAFALFTLYPLAQTAIFGFTDMSGAKAVQSGEYSFLEDPFFIFKDLLFNNPSFIKALVTTVKIWMLNFVPQVVLALALTAWFTSRRNNIRGKGAFKVLFYMPNIITAGSIAVLFAALFADHSGGPINYVLGILGIEGVPFRFSEMQAGNQYIVAFIQFWMWYGYTMLILISGVLGLNPEIFEVSEIDGANGIQQFFLITLPNLKSILLYMLVTSIVGGLTMFDIPMLFRDGGPVGATTTLSLFIYKLAGYGTTMRFNYAAAASMLVFLLIAVLSVFTFYLLRDKDAARQRKEEKALIRAAKASKKEAAL